MNAISNFTFHEKHNVRVQLLNGEPWFCLVDVCNVLSIPRNSDLVQVSKGFVENETPKNRGGLDEKGVVKNLTPTNGGKQQLIYINEPNLYRVIFRSNKPEAKQFQDWVFNEVLPSIRKTGRYETTKATDTRDYLTNNDMNNIKRLIWACSSNVSHGKAFENGIWHALRQVTGVPSPSRFEVKHLPVLADEFQRILNILEPYFEARRICEESLIKRVLRERADHIIINELLDQMITVTNTAKTSIKKQIDKTITSQACINLKNRNVCDHKYA